MVAPAVRTFGSGTGAKGSQLMLRHEERRFEIPVDDAVALEAAIYAPAAPRFVALVLHPHPQYGGDMDNHVVSAMCDALAEFGATLRFNFRGTGRSSGSHDGGRAEQDDALTAVAVARHQVPNLPLLLTGYSFGAQIAAAVCDRAEASGLILVSPPLAYGGIANIVSSAPVLAIAGDRDPVCPDGMLRALDSETTEVRIVPGADHSWLNGIGEMVAAIRSFGLKFHRS